MEINSIYGLDRIFNIEEIINDFFNQMIGSNLSKVKLRAKSAKRLSLLSKENIRWQSAYNKLFDFMDDLSEVSIPNRNLLTRKKEETVSLWVDGGINKTLPSLNVGGCGGVLISKEKSSPLKFGVGAIGDKVLDRRSTVSSSTMELLAATIGINHFYTQCYKPWKQYEVQVYSDSAYFINSMNEHLYKWVKNGWKKADKKPVSNAVYFRFFYLLCTSVIFKNVKFTFTHVPGHAGIEWNEEADRLATRSKEIAFTKLTTS